jgi:hypothetical protein
VLFPYAAERFGEEPVLLLWLVARDPAVVAVAVVLFDLTWTRPSDGGWIANSLVRLMFPEPPRPPACYGTRILILEEWVDRANVTHDDYLLAQFLRFGFGWFGGERELEIGHIAVNLCALLVETESETGDET